MTHQVPPLSNASSIILVLVMVFVCFCANTTEYWPFVTVPCVQSACSSATVEPKLNPLPSKSVPLPYSICAPQGVTRHGCSTAQRAATDMSSKFPRLLITRSCSRHSPSKRMSLVTSSCHWLVLRQNRCQSCSLLVPRLPPPEHR